MYFVYLYLYLLSLSLSLLQHSRRRAPPRARARTGSSLDYLFVCLSISLALLSQSLSLFFQRAWGACQTPLYLSFARGLGPRGFPLSPRSVVRQGCGARGTPCTVSLSLSLSFVRVRGTGVSPYARAPSAPPTCGWAYLEKHSRQQGQYCLCRSNHSSIKALAIGSGTKQQVKNTRTAT